MKIKQFVIFLNFILGYFAVQDYFYSDLNTFNLHIGSKYSTSAYYNALFGFQILKYNETTY